ncbi:MASE3 domain-containing protein [Methanoregula sp. PtaB.Bin085]|uniref:sensor histidine kinase n=1 Tax=Methanoregula sp. PtaB.Bin085 TaxID=1811680 RepID=UPI0009D5C9D4|nr:MASE3 domain-containing protein [Methanoregula sp. PtaB.Bin085]OPX64449.1 MAG: sensory histidine kinase AtoS [Methanoregula sp. PtaB.Bin085]
MDGTSSAGESERVGKTLISGYEVVLIAGVLCILYFISTADFLLFHALVELAGIAVVFSIFVIIWNSRRFLPDGFFLIVGISFLFFGCIDLVHTLAYKGMGVFPGSNADLPTQLWIAARYFQSIAFLVATFFIGRPLTETRKYDTAIVVAACSAVAALFFASIFFWKNFPQCYIEGSGLTPFKIVSEYVISAILVATILIMYRKRDHFEPGVFRLLVTAQAFLIAGEIAFTSYVGVYGFMNMLGHLFRLLSVYFFYRVFVVIGLTRPYDLIFRELRMSERQVRDEEEKYRKLFDNMMEGFAYCRMIYDADGRPADWEYLEVNKAFGRLTGLSNIRGRRALDAIPGIREMNPELFDIYGRVASTGNAETFEIDFKPLKMWLRVSVFCPEKGYFVAVFEDVTERRQAAEALKQANAKLNLLSTITRHDIKNQIFTLKAYLGFSKETLGDAGKTAEYILKEERAVDAIERQILFTKEYEDLGVRSPVWQQVRRKVDEAAASLPMRDIRLDVTIADIEIYADPLLGKVFYNLIDNALRYGGQQMTRVRITSEESGEGLLIRVEDDGAGIPATDRKQIFERGFGRHSGLGLFLSREILSITGITIAENSEHGNGARFEIVVPPGAWRQAAPS